MDQGPGGHGGSHLGVGVGAGGGVGGRRLAVHPDLTPFTISLLIYPIFASTSSCCGSGRHPSLRHWPCWRRGSC